MAIVMVIDAVIMPEEERVTPVDMQPAIELQHSGMYTTTETEWHERQTTERIG
jgi:hypothetical protein